MLWLGAPQVRAGPAQAVHHRPYICDVPVPARRAPPPPPPRRYMSSWEKAKKKAEAEGVTASAPAVTENTLA